jgi:hypothetical protein
MDPGSFRQHLHVGFKIMLDHRMEYRTCKETQDFGVVTVPGKVAARA